MAISIRPEEKYAFLFTGDTDQRFENDIMKVYDTLTNYYGYLVGQIWVVSGGGSFPTATFTGANEVLITTEAELITAMEAFTQAARTIDVDRPSGTLNNAFLYFTGKGSREEISFFDTSLLVINGVEPVDVTAIKISGKWLKTAIQIDEEATALAGSDVTDNALLNNCQIDIYCEQSNGGGFYDDTPTALNLLLSENWSFSSACNNGETSSGGTTGSNFTDAWVNGLNMVALSSGPNSGKYADEITADTEDTTNLLVSLRKAWTYAKEVSSNTGIYNETGPAGDEMKYLGLPSFLIRDGDQQPVPRAWWESPDIFITNTVYPSAADNDWYVTGEKNTIHIRVKNNGTHPVRKFWLGAKNFGSGIGATDFIYRENLSTDSIDPLTILSGVIKANDEYEHTYDVDFTVATNHRCIKARAQIMEILQIELDESDDWSITVEDDEAQRNIDQYVAPPPPAPAPDVEPEPEPEPPEPDEGAIPDTDTEAEAAPEMEDAMEEETEETAIPPDEEPTKLERRGIRNIRRYREHLYEIKNHFKQKHKFLLVFPKEYYKYKELFRMEWFERPVGISKQLIPLKIEEKPFLHLSFDIEPGETKRILSYLALKKGIEIGKKQINLPFEILVDKKETKKEVKIQRQAMISEFRPKYSPVAGLTLAIKQGEAELKGTIIDKGGEPISNALVFLRTANKRQGAVLRTRKNGNFKVAQINPDVYGVMVVAKDWYIKEKMFLLKDGNNTLKISTENAIAGKPFKVILDRIRILDDKDPIFFGKGEFAFTTAVAADGDVKKQQVNRLPEKGHFKISDRPGRNEIELGVIIFDGSAQKSLSIGISGKEFDFLTRDDDLKRYSRVLTGNPNKWYGKYSPDNEYLDKERVGDWEVWYRIVRM